MGYIIAPVNMKGGVGKTTVTVNLATCLAKEYGYRVLIVDLDTQINATLSLMPPPQLAMLRKEKRTLKNLIDQATYADVPVKFPIQDIIRRNICKVNGLDLLPGDIELYNDFLLAEILYSKSGGEQQDFERTWKTFEDALVQGILQPIRNTYDFILLDFAPGDHLLTRSGMVASDFYLIPAKPEPLSLIGMGILEGHIKRLKESQRTKTRLLGIVFTSIGHSTKMAAGVRNRVSTDFGEDKIFNTMIPFSVAVAQAVDEFKPVVLTAPKTTGAKAFNELTVEFLQKLSTALGNKRNSK